jgi:ABC-type siderophore export system fused ATPase/permease subunit
MKNNIGRADKSIGIMLAIGVAILYSMNLFSVTITIVLGILFFAFLLTSFIGFCPLYRLIGVSTCKKRSKTLY